MNADTPAALPLILVSVGPAAARDRVIEELGRRYGDDYGIVAADSAADLRTRIRAAAKGGDRVALVLTDDPAPLVDTDADADTDAEGGGETVFVEARRLFPDARRGLLVEWGAWAHRTTVTTVLDLMARVLIDYYVVLPTHSPDE
ncbi:MAG TPA: hypothetical protein VEX88_01660, partial [Glaciibacter sp.]|nr:hypothetical protein [Glaciibacter sp.]